MNIWDVCQGIQQITPVQGTLYRLVESQEQIATREFVDTLEEQALLEEMIEANKPAYPFDPDGLHYLLKTPFRYPPLKWGSRFGRVHEPSLFYGGCSVDVTLIESAYYRFVFWHSMEQTLDKIIRSEHTLISVDYEAARGIKLQCPPFDQYVDLIANPTDYRHSQEIGSNMRSDGISVFEYTSARSKERAPCVGIYEPTHFLQSKPKTTEQWFCDLGSDGVVFKAVQSSNIFKFDLEQFKCDGKFPFPA